MINLLATFADADRNTKVEVPASQPSPTAMSGATASQVSHSGWRRSVLPGCVSLTTGRLAKTNCLWGRPILAIPTPRLRKASIMSGEAFKDPTRDIVYQPGPHLRLLELIELVAKPRVFLAGVGDDPSKESLRLGVGIDFEVEVRDALPLDGQEQIFDFRASRQNRLTRGGTSKGLLRFSSRGRAAVAELYGWAGSRVVDQPGWLGRDF